MGVGLRSGLYGVGGPPPWIAGRYYVLPKGPPGTNGGLGIGTLRVYPVYVPNSATITRIGAEVTVAGDAGSKLRIGIYADDGTGRPGSLALDAGQIAGDSATVQEITGLSKAIGPGWYWFGAVVQSVAATQPTIRTAPVLAAFNVDDGASIPSAGSSNYGFSATGVTGALPATFTVAGQVGVAPRIFIKL